MVNKLCQNDVFQGTKKTQSLIKSLRPLTSKYRQTLTSKERKNQSPLRRNDI